MKPKKTIKVYNSFEEGEDDLLLYHLSLSPLQRFAELRKMQAWFKQMMGEMPNEKTIRQIVQKSLPEDWKRF